MSGGSAHPPPAGTILVHPEDSWPGAAAQAIGAGLAEARGSAGGMRSLVLSGGSTPAPVYRLLATHGDVPWEIVQVFFADERFVPAGHLDSNFKMVEEALLGPLGPRAPRSDFAGDEGQRTLGEAAARYASLLPPVVDVLVLGIGEDGHTASLFPAAPNQYGAPVPGTAVPRVIPVHHSPKPPPRRITITPSVILDARHLFVLATGASKAAAVRSALSGAWDPRRCPAQWARNATWILDPDAASLL